METISSIGSLGLRAFGYKSAIHTVGSALVLGDDVIRRIAFFAFDKAAALKNAASKKLFEKEEDSEEKVKGCFARFTGYVGSFSAVETAGTWLTPARPKEIDAWTKLGTHYGARLWETGKGVLLTALLIEVANYLAAPQGEGINSVLKFVTPVRFSSDSLISPVLTGVRGLWGTVAK